MVSVVKSDMADLMAQKLFRGIKYSVSQHNLVKEVKSHSPHFSSSAGHLRVRVALFGVAV